MKNAFSPPGKDTNDTNTGQSQGGKADKKAIMQFIENAGKVPILSREGEPDDIKSFNIKMYNSYLWAINDAKQLRKPIPGKKISVTTHAYILEAIEEKIARDGIKIEGKE